MLLVSVVQQSVQFLLHSRVHLGFIRIAEVWEECRVKAEHAVDLLLGFLFFIFDSMQPVISFHEKRARLGVHCGGRSAVHVLLAVCCCEVVEVGQPSQACVCSCTS